jgi:hypothetical protein
MTMYSFLKISLIAMLVLTTIAMYLFIDMFNEYVPINEIFYFIITIVVGTLVTQKLYKL